MKGFIFKSRTRCFQVGLIAIMFIVSGCGGGDDAAERVNNPPVAVNDTSTVVKGSAITLDLAINDTDVDDGLDLASITIIAPPANGSVIVNADGSVEYTHDNSDTASDTFTYSIKDKSGAASNTATVNLSINNLPVAVNDASTVIEAMAVTIDLADNDNDTDDGLDLGSITVVTLPVNGSVVVNADGTVKYIHNGSETVFDMFTYSIRDNRGAASNTAAVNISVTPVNDQPLAVDDASTLSEGMAATINLANNDIDADDGLNLASITIVSSPVNGSLIAVAGGGVEYTLSLIHI